MFFPVSGYQGFGFSISGSYVKLKTKVETEVFLISSGKAYWRYAPWLSSRFKTTEEVLMSFEVSLSSFTYILPLDMVRNL